MRARTTLGDFELTLCTDGTYLLDGGAMFGVVPKMLWQKAHCGGWAEPHLLGLNTTIVRTGKHTVVIETGIGNKQSPKMREIQGNQELLPASLPPPPESILPRSISSSTRICTSTTAAGIPPSSLTAPSLRPSPTPGTSPMPARSRTAIFNSIVTASATFRPTTTPSSNPAR